MPAPETLSLFPAKEKNNTTNDRNADSDVWLPVHPVLVICRYLEFPDIHNLLFGDVGKPRVQAHDQAYNEENDADVFHDAFLP